MKWDLKLWRYKISEWWNSQYRNKVVLAVLALIFFLALLIPFIISVTKSSTQTYTGEVTTSLKERFNGKSVSCVDDIKERGEIVCRRGPIVLSANDIYARTLLEYKSTSAVPNTKILASELNSNSNEAINYRSHWGLLPDLTNWFYENVAWGPEFLTFSQIKIVGDSPISRVPNYTIPGLVLGKWFGKSLSGIQIYLKSILSGNDYEVDKFIKDPADNQNPLVNRLDTLKYNLMTAYNNYKMHWYTGDQSSKYEYGGVVESRRFIEVLNKKVGWDYLKNRFLGVDKEIFGPKIYNRETAYERLNTIYAKELNQGTLNRNSDPNKLSYLDLFVLANDTNKLSTVKSFELFDVKNNPWIYDGVDFSALVDQDLSVFQLENQALFNKFKTLKISDNKGIERPIGDLTKDIVIQIMDGFDGRVDALFTTKLNFNGYFSSWMQNYFLKLIVPILWTETNNTVNDHSLGTYSTLKDSYNLLIKNNPAQYDWQPKTINYNEFNDTDFETPQKKSIGFPNFVSPLDYFNQMRLFMIRDWLALTNNQSLFKHRGDFNANENNALFKELNLLNNFGANPYDGAKISETLKMNPNFINALQKVLRIEEDVTMGFFSNSSEKSVLWGYMNEEDDFDTLQLENSQTKTKHQIRITTQKDLDVSFNACPNEVCTDDKRHSLLSNEYINNEQQNPLDVNSNVNKTFLGKISNVNNNQIILKKPRKLWVSDFSLLADYKNAVASSGDYKISFLNSKNQTTQSLKISDEWASYGIEYNNQFNILNSSASSIEFAGWTLYRQKNAKDTELYFKIPKASWN